MGQGQQDGQPDNDSAMALNASWAYTVYRNGTSTQPTVWYSINGANYSDDFSLRNDVCAISIQNISMQAQYNGRNDNGSCLSTFDQDCVDALKTLGTNTANLLVGNSSSFDASSNLTQGVLPQICDRISNTIGNNFPSECLKFWNDTIFTQGQCKPCAKNSFELALTFSQP